MQTQLQVYQDTPLEFAMIREFMVQRLVEFMHSFGIQGITTTWTPVGASGVLAVDFTPITPDPPGNFLVMRPKIVRWVAEGMHSLGIMALETHPTAEDIKGLVSAWDKAAEAVAQHAQQAAQYSEKLPPMTDPSNENELDKESEDGQK